MATITMDASEYEALKKNIALLEEAKKREEKLNEEIHSLQQEKIQVLKDNETSVTIEKRTVKDEFIHIQRDPREIAQAFCDLARNWTVGNKILDERDIDRLINMCFRKSQSIGVVVDETVTTRGFDQVKAELEEKWTKELSEENKRALQLADEYEDEVR